MRVVVARLDELEEERLMTDLPDGEAVLIIRRDDRVYALAAMCPHQYAPLIGGDIEDGVLTCPLHGWRFGLETGADPDNPYICVQTWPAGVEGDAIWVEMGGTLV